MSGLESVLVVGESRPARKDVQRQLQRQPLGNKDNFQLMVKASCMQELPRDA